MKNLKKFIALGLATIAAVSAMSMTALADYKDVAYASLPTLSEVDTSKASRENPVKYVDEKTGATVTIYDPNITVNFKPFDLNDLDDLNNSENQKNIVLDGRIYVPYIGSKTFGTVTDSFQAPYDGKINFTLPVFTQNKFNVSLNKEGVTGSPLAVVLNQPVNTSVVLTGLDASCRYEFRLSSYEGAGNSAYIANTYKSSETFLYNVNINVMTKQQMEELQSKAKDNIVTANTYLTKNNQNGTNGSICSPFVAEKNGMVFVLTNAPGATNYNVQLYEGKVGQGKAVSNYATTDVNNGVYFTGLTIGKEYYIKISSSTLVTSGCTATYETIAFDA